MFEELKDDLSGLDRELSLSSRHYLTAGAEYDSRGDMLESMVLSQVDVYLDPANYKARIIQEAPRELANNLMQFGALRADLDSELTLLRFQLNVFVGSTTLEVLQLFTLGLGTSTQRAADSYDSFLMDLDRTRARSIVAGVQAVVLGKRTVEAQRVATSLIRLRQGKLEHYLGEASSLQTTAELEAASDVLMPDAREAAYKAILEAAAKALGVAAETIVPMVKLATIAYDLHASLNRIKDRYRRGEIDEFLDFSDQVSAENETARRTIELVRALGVAMASGVPA